MAIKTLARLQHPPQAVGPDGCLHANGQKAPQSARRGLEFDRDLTNTLGEASTEPFGAKLRVRAARDA